MPEIPSFIKLRLPMQVTGYTRAWPVYAARICMVCATYPRAVATASSVTSLCSGIVKGGAGSFVVIGMGKGTSNIVKRRSGGDSNSMGNIVERMDSRLLCIKRNLLWRFVS